MGSHETIFHTTSVEEWEKAVAANVYEAPTLKTEGFMHCSTREQMQDTLNLYYKDKRKVMVLEIGVKKVKSEVKWEMAPERKQLFPHIYGPLQIDEVVDATVRERTGDEWPGFESALKIDDEFAQRLEQGWKKRKQDMPKKDEPFDYENDYPSDHYTDEEEDAKPKEVAVTLPSKFVALAEEENDADDNDDEWD